MSRDSIDREVAEKVMGYHFHKYPVSDGGSYQYRDEQGRRCTRYGFSPSTRIDHAWEVVEKLRHIQPADNQYTLTWPFELVWRTDGDDRSWIAQFLRPDGHPAHEGEAETAPLAICRAALAAMED